MLQGLLEYLRAAKFLQFFISMSSIYKSRRTRTFKKNNSRYQKIYKDICVIPSIAKIGLVLIRRDLYQPTPVQKM